MATQRLSQLQRRILQWLAADHQRTKGFILSSHEELVKALRGDKGTISRSLRTPGAANEEPRQRRYVPVVKPAESLGIVRGCLQ